MKNQDRYLIRPVRKVKDYKDYKAALAWVAPYFDNEPEVDSDAAAHFEAMVTLIEAYEAKHYPIAPPDPIEAIEAIEAILFRMAQQGLKPNDLLTRHELSMNP